jgi:hypothetical protein
LSSSSHLASAMEVFELFDEVILLTQGLVAYHGNCSDLESLLTELDVPRPRGGYTSLADFSLDVISIDCPQQRIEELTQHFTSFQAQSHYNEAQAAVDYALKHGNLTASAIVGSDHGSSIWSMFRCSRHDRSYITSTKHQFLWLFNLMQLLSTRGSELYQRVANSIVMSLIIGIMFLSVDAEDYQVKGSVLFLALLCPSMSCLDALPKYVQSRVLFNADNSDGLYSAFAYYAATSCVYLFLGLSSNAIFTAICYWMCGNLCASSLLSKAIGWVKRVYCFRKVFFHSISAHPYQPYITHRPAGRSVCLPLLLPHCASELHDHGGCHHADQHQL